MSTKEKGYVKSTNGICYVESSQSLKVKYFMAVEQNVARSCKLFVFLCRCLFRSVMVLPQSLDDILPRKSYTWIEMKENWAENIPRLNLYSRKG